MKKCFSCGKKINISEKPTRNDICEKCGVYLRVCYNCTFFSESSSNKCSEPQAEWIPEKEKANFCDFFMFADKDYSRNSDISNEDAKSKFDDLFK